MKIISLFAGAGGFDVGFHDAGFETVWANEWKATAAQTWRNKFGDAMHEGDLVGYMERGETPGPGIADVLIGGPPCQGFSTVGKMDPKDPRSKHVYNFLEVARKAEPKMFVMENVAALGERAQWSFTKHEIMRRAGDVGYEVEAFVLNSVHFGVPQRRRRVFFVGRRKGLGLRYAPPRPTTPDKPVTIREAFSKLPPFDTPGNDTKTGAVFVARERPRIDPRNPWKSKLLNGYGQPMNPDDAAYTVTASSGNCMPALDVWAWERGAAESWTLKHIEAVRRGDPFDKTPPKGALRRITVEEAAALQTFPPDMPWSGATSARVTQIGNAVPPLLAYHLGVSVMKALRGETDAEPNPFFDEMEAA